MPLIYAWLVAAINALLLLFAPDDTPTLQLVYASLMLWLCTLPMLIRVLYKRNDIPFIEAVSVVHFIYYGFAVFSGESLLKHTPTSVDAITSAVGIALHGQAMMLVGFYGLGAVAWRNSEPPRLRLDLDIKQVGAPLFLLLTASTLLFTLIVALGNVPTSVRGLVANLASLPLVFLCALLLLRLRGRLSLPLSIAAVALLVVNELLLLTRGLVLPALVAIVPFFFTYIKEKRALPYKSAALVLLCVFPLLAAKMQYRERVWNQGYGLIEKVEVFYDIIVGTLDDPHVVRYTTEQTRGRTSYLATFARVVETTPSRVPYWNGESYRSAIYFFVPRIFAPDKPKKDMGQRFGHRYGLIRPNDLKTSVNFALLVEMYANFGLVGVFVISFLVGMYYRFLYFLLNHGKTDGATLASSVIFSYLLLLESDASMILVGVIPTIVVLVVALSALSVVTSRSGQQVQASSSYDG